VVGRNRLYFVEDTYSFVDLGLFSRTLYIYIYTVGLKLTFCNFAIFLKKLPSDFTDSFWNVFSGRVHMGQGTVNYILVSICILDHDPDSGFLLLDRDLDTKDG